MEETPKSIKNSFKNLTINVLTGICLLLIGYFTCKFTQIKNPDNGTTWTTKDVTIGVTANSGFMIYNHVNGRFEAYDDTLGRLVFNGYAAKLAYESSRGGH